MASGREDKADAETRWLSYDELACVRGIDRASAIRLVRRKRWPKRDGNDGTVRVAVPADIAEDTPRTKPHVRRDVRGDRSREINLLKAELSSRDKQLTEAHARAEAAEERAVRAKARLHELGSLVDALRGQAEAARAAADKDAAKVADLTRETVERAVRAKARLHELGSLVDALRGQAEAARAAADKDAAKVADLTRETVERAVRAEELRAERDDARAEAAAWRRADAERARWSRWRRLREAFRRR